MPGHVYIKGVNSYVPPPPITYTGFNVLKQDAHPMGRVNTTRASVALSSLSTWAPCYCSAAVGREASQALHYKIKRLVDKLRNRPSAIAARGRAEVNK